MIFMASSGKRRGIEHHRSTALLPEAGAHGAPKMTLGLATGLEGDQDFALQELCLFVVQLDVKVQVSHVALKLVPIGVIVTHHAALVNTPSMRSSFRFGSRSR
jgi:hypothetical protein